MKNIILFLLYNTLIISTLFAQENIGFFDPYKLKRGMKGYGLTVFQGLEPEKIEGEVIAFMPGKFAKAGMILMKFSGKNIERTGVAAGMSGSPIYIDGKLVGALAYGWSFSRELIAGIVPIQDMISDKQRGGNTAYIPPQATPIQTIWAIDGLNDSTLVQELQNISPTETYTQGIEESITVPSSRSNNIAPLKAGDAVAIKLIEGDLNAAAIGTVTYVEGENVYIFGHPLDGEGPITLPLARAEIYDILSSQENSFKMGRALPQTIGATVFDGLSAVYGRFDKKAMMVPVKINVQAKEYSNIYNMNMARSRKYLPTLIGRGLGAVLQRELGKNVEKQVNLSWKLEFTNNQVVSNSVTWVKNTIYEPTLIKEYWENYISILWKNKLTHLVPTSIELNIDIMDERYNYYSVESAVVTKKEFLPGDKISIDVGLQKYLAQGFSTNMNLQLPNNIKEGSYSLIIGSALAIESELTELFPEKYMIRSEQQLLQELRKNINTHILKAVLVDTQNGSVIGASFFGNIPKARQSLFQSKYNTGESMLAPKLTISELDMDLPIIGGIVKIINIVVPDPILPKQ